MVLFQSTSLAANNSIVCFTENDAGQIVVQLEKTKLLEEEIDLLKLKSDELSKQITLLEEQKKKQQEQLEVAQKTIDSYKSLLETQKQAYEEQIKKSKPSVMKQLGTILGSIGIGVLIGVLL